MTADVDFGYSLCFDGDRFQLRTTDRGNGPEPSGCTGQITTDGTIARAEVFKDEEADRAVVGERRIDFHFRTFSWQHGVAFRVDGGRWVAFRLYRNGHLIATDHIFVGPDQANPPGDPFAVVY